MPEDIYYSKARERVEADTLVLVLVFIIPLIILPFLFPNKFVPYYLGFMILGFISYGIGNYYRKYRIQNELSKSSVLTKGIVRGKRYFNSLKGTGHWEYFCEFEHSDYIYSTFYQTDYKNKIDDGDTLVVLFLERNPDISKVIIPADYQVTWR